MIMIKIWLFFRTGAPPVRTPEARRCANGYDRVMTHYFSGNWFDPVDGARVAITGGTSGLGLALVRELSGRGARVAFVARDPLRVARIAERTGTHGVTGDIARKEDIHPIALQIVGLLGGLDILVNNASSLGPVPLALSPTPIARISSSRSRPTCSARSA